MGTVNLGEVSPVLQSFLAGRGSQINLLELAQKTLAQREEAKQRQQEIDNMMKRFDVSAKQEDTKIQQQHDMFNVTRQAHVEEAKQHLFERLRQSPETAPGTTQNYIIPGAIPGAPTASIPNNIVNIPGMQTRATPPAVGTPVTEKTPYGEDITVNMPQSAGDSNIADAMKLFGLQEPLKEAAAVRQYKATIGDTKTRELENKLDLADIRQSSANEVARIREEALKYGADARMQSSLLQQQMAFHNQMFNMFGPGVQSPEQVKDLIAKTGTAIALGHDSMNNVPAHLKGAVNSFLQNTGWSVPSGGPKFRDELMKTSQSSDRLLNDFDQLDKEFPAGSNAASRISNARGSIPFVGGYTEIGQRFKRYGDNIATYAAMTGETPGMMRSPVLATKAESAAPLPTDSPTTRWNKRINSVDLALTKLAGGVSALASKDQRISFWKDAIGNLDSLKGNYAFKDVLEDILKTGEYHPTMLNKLKK